MTDLDFLINSLRAMPFYDWRGAESDLPEEAASALEGLRDAYNGAMEDKRMWKRRAQALGATE